MRTPPPPPLMVPTTVQDPDPSCPSQQATSGTHHSTPTPVDLQPTPGGRPPTPPQPQSQPLQETPTTSPTTRLEVSEPRPSQPPSTGQSQSPPSSAGEGEAPIAIVGDTTTTTDYFTGYQATPAVRRDISRAAGADDGPPFDKDATLDTGGRASAQKATAVSVQTGATASIKDVTDDARRGTRREELGTRADSKPAAAATTDSVTDSRGEWAATRGAPGRFLRVLRGLGGPDGVSRQLPSMTPPAVYAALRVRAATDLRCPGRRATAPNEEADRRAFRQHSAEVYGSGDGGHTTRVAD